MLVESISKSATIGVVSCFGPWRNKGSLVMLVESISKSATIGVVSCLHVHVYHNLSEVKPFSHACTSKITLKLFWNKVGMPLGLAHRGLEVT